MAVLMFNRLSIQFKLTALAGLCLFLVVSLLVLVSQSVSYTHLTLPTTPYV